MRGGERLRAMLADRGLLMVQINAREHVEWMLREGRMHAAELMDALDAADDVYAVADEFGELAPDVSLQDEARRLVVFETRVRQLLIEWGAVDPLDESPPDPIDVLRMLLG